MAMRAQRLAVAAMLVAPALAQAAPAALGPADRTFLVKDAQGGAYELASAKLAADKASDGAVKSYARKLVSDHDGYNAALARLGQNKGLTLPTDMNGEDKARLARLEKLSGPAFDRAYVAEALRINAEDKRDADKEQRATKDGDIKAFIGQFASMDAEHETLARDLKSAGK